MSQTSTDSQDDIPEWLSEVGKCVVAFYRRLEALPIPNHQATAISLWIEHVPEEERSFLQVEWKKLNERIAGGKVLQALALSKEEWNAARQEENAKIASSVCVDEDYSKKLYEAQKLYRNSANNVNNMSLMTKLDRAARDAMSVGDYEKAMTLMVEKKKLEWNERLDIETNMHRTNVAYVLRKDYL